MAEEREAGPRRWTREDLAHALLLVLATLATWLPRARGSIDLRFDAGVYYTLGTSLAEGRGYRLLNEPGEIRAVQYPPLLPAVVAAHQLALRSSDPLVVGPALRRTNLLCSLAFALACHALARRFLRPRLALCAALLPVLYFHTLYLEDLLFAELPFALVLMLFLLAASTRSRWRHCAYFLAAAAFFLRTAGLAVLAGWTVAAVLARDWRAAAGRGLLTLVCVLGWQSYVRSVTAAPDYAQPAYPYQRAPYQYYNVSYAENVALIDPFRPEAGRITAPILASRMVEHAWPLFLGLGESVSTTRGYWEWPLRAASRILGRYLPLKLALLPPLAFTLLVCAGLWRASRRDPTPALVLLSSLGLIALTPWPAQFLRYMMPFAPLAAIGLVLSLERLARHGRWRVTLGLTVAFGAQLFCMRQTFALFQHPVQLPGPPDAPREARHFLFEEARQWRALYAGIEWLRTGAPPGARVASTTPHLVWLYAGHQAVLPPLEVDPARAQEQLDAVPVDYLVIDALAFLDLSRRYAAPVVEAFPQHWRLVFHAADDLRIYARVR